MDDLPISTLALDDLPTSALDLDFYLLSTLDLDSLLWIWILSWNELDMCTQHTVWMVLLKKNLRINARSYIHDGSNMLESCI